MADAIGRTLWRLGVSRRHLLEWIPAAQAAIGPRLDVMGFARRMAGAIVDRRGRGDRRAGVPPWILAGGASLRRALAGFARVARFVSLPPAAASRLPMTDADAQALRRTARRTWRFFETFVTRGRQHAAARQFPGRSRARGRASDLADQYRPLSAFGRLRARFRLDRNRSGDRSAGGDARDDGPHATRARSSLQLVRHARSSPARAEIRIHRRQRQSRGASDRARQCLQGMAGPSARCGAAPRAASPTRST